MPVYTFKHPKENTYIDIIQKMSDNHVYFDESGLEWQRIWYVPQAAIDTKWDINNPKDFVEKTRNKRGTLGDLYDKSSELSKSRRDKYGVDRVKERFYKDYEKQKGKPHIDKRREKVVSDLGKRGVSVDFTPSKED